MKTTGLSIIVLITAMSAMPCFAQAQDLGEVIVTAQRREAISAQGGSDDEDAAAKIPAIGLRRTADFAVWFVSITGDTRDEAKRQEEIYGMLRNAVGLAARSGGIELATGTYVVEPLTEANYRNIPLSNAGRPDSELAAFIIKAPLKGGADAKAALAKVEAFIKAVPTVGRAELRRTGDQTLSIVNPDQYRGAIADLIAKDAQVHSAKFGASYGVELRGVDRPVEWSRISLTDVLLYLPYSYTIRPIAP
jgi:hypothetical protein